MKKRKQGYKAFDGIDIHVEILPVPFEKLAESRTGETSAAIRERVIRAREIQARRYAGEPEIHCNAQITPKLQGKYCALTPEAMAILKRAMEKNDMSARAYDRILKVERTIADLDGAENIGPQHISEAVNYRTLDRGGCGTTAL